MVRTLRLPKTELSMLQISASAPEPMCALDLKRRSSNRSGGRKKGRCTFTSDTDTVIAQVLMSAADRGIEDAGDAYGTQTEAKQLNNRWL